MLQIWGYLRSKSRNPGNFTLVAIVALLLLSSESLSQPQFFSLPVYEPPKPSASQPTAPVAALIGELSNESLEKRHAAANALLGMGPDIQPQLQWALERETAAIPREELELGPQQSPGELLPRYAYHELSVLIDHMNERRHSTGSVITLHYQDAPLFDVLRDLGKQADAVVSLQAVGEQLDWARTARATVDINQLGYWNALRAIGEQMGLRPPYYRPASGLALSRQPGTVNRSQSRVAAKSVVSGPMLIAPFSIESRRSVNLQSGEESTGVTLTLQAFVEPKVSAGGLAIVRIDECVDDQGQSLLIGARPSFHSIETQDRTLKVPVELAAPAVGGRIRTIKGQFGVSVYPPSRYMMLTDIMLAREPSLHFDGLVVTVKSVFHLGSYYRTNLEVSVPAESPYTRTLFLKEDSSFWLWDQSRRAIPIHRQSEGFERKGEREIAEMTLSSHDSAPAPATLAWITPATRWFMVPFELHDISVPASRGE